jgi:hypothetical protein
MRYAVATNFADGRAYFTGAFGVGERFNPVVDPRTDKALALGRRAAADAVAVGLTELSGGLPPFDARTWFVVELPEACR